MARFFLPARAFAPRAKLLERLFRSADVGFMPFAERLTESLSKIFQTEMTVDRELEVPVDQPVAWREKSKSILGKQRHHLYLNILLAIFAMSVLICTRLFTTISLDTFAIIYFGMLALITLVILVQGTSLISKERTRQTLDVLLVAPLTNEQILKQKMTAILSLQRSCALSLLFVLTGQSLWVTWANPIDVLKLEGDGWNSLTFVVFAIATSWLWLKTLAWFSVLIGLWSNSRIQAISISVCVVSAWLILPEAIIAILQLWYDPTLGLLTTVSPIVFPLYHLYSEYSELCTGSRFMQFTAHMVFQTIIYGSFRLATLRSVQEALKRDDFDAPDAEVMEAVVNRLQRTRTSL